MSQSKHQTPSTKHLTLYTLLLFALLTSCSHTYEVRTINLKTQKDSVSYAMGYMSGMQSSFFVKDTTGQALVDFMTAYDMAAKGAFKNASEAYKQAYQMGLGLKNYEQKGMYLRKTLPMNGPVVLQGFVNGMYLDSTQMTRPQAQDIYNRYLFLRKNRNRLDQTVPATLCPTAQAYIELLSPWDSVSYMAGWINGIRIGEKLTDDNREAEIKDQMAGVNAALQTSYAFPSAAGRAVGLGITYYKWQSTGKVGQIEVSVVPKIYYQGLINGLQQDTTMMTMPHAIKYIKATHPELFSSKK